MDNERESYHNYMLRRMKEDNEKAIMENAKRMI